MNNLVGMFECRGKPPLVPAGEKGQDSPAAEHRTPPPVSKFRRKPSKPESKAQKLAGPANLKKQLGFLHKQASAPERSDPPKTPGKVPILPPPAPKAVKSQATSSGPSKSTASTVTTTAVSRPVPVMASSERQNPPRGAKVGGAKVGGASVGIAAIMQNFEFQPRKVNGGDSHQKPSREEKFTASETSPKILKKRPSQETFVSSVAVGVSARPSPVSQDKARPKRPLAPVKLLKDREIEGGGADSCPRTHRAADVRKKGEEITPSPATEEAIYENVSHGKTVEKAPKVPKHRVPQTSAAGPSNPPPAENPPPSPQQSDQKPLPAPPRHDYENILIREPVGRIQYLVESDDDSPLSADEEGLGPPEEVIYENFGPDQGNRLMNPEELEKHISSKGKKGLSAEYLKIRNEPLMGFYKTCK